MGDTPQALRPLLPCPLGQNPSPAAGNFRSSRTKAKTKVACRPCHDRKLKCDGARPACSTCSKKSTSCSYDIEEGQTRQSSLKRKNEVLQQDLGGTLDLLWHIQHTSDVDSHAIFDRLRGGEDPSTILASFSLLDLGGQQPQKRPSLSSSSSGGKSASIPSSLAVIPEQAAVERADNQRLLLDVPGSIPFAIPDFSDPAPLAAALRAQSETFNHAFSVFLQCTATLFHVYSQEQVNEVLDSFLRSDEPVSLSTLCEACSIAAVGSRYSRSEIAAEKGDYYFNVTKLLLDECIEKSPPRAIKVCALLAMCNIVNKSTVAFAYVELGLAVARLHGLFGKDRPPDLDSETWMDSKKVFRSLVLCRGWLQTTLSYISLDEDPEQLINVDVESEHDFEDTTFYQIQVTKLTLVESSNFRRMQNANFSMDSSKAIRDSLGRWLQALPEEMKLENLTRASRNPETRISALYLHSFYLGGEMLSYRWILSWAMQQRQSANDVSEELEQEASRWADDGVSAAKKSAEVLHTLYIAGAAVRHCWLCIFQGYLSSCILLYDTTQKILRGHSWDGNAQNLNLAAKSLEVLSWASRLDATASQYYTVLKPILDIVNTATTQPLKVSSFPETVHEHFIQVSGSSPLHNVARQLAQMLYVPLTNPQKDDEAKSRVYRPSLEQTATNLGEVGLGVHLYWALEFTAAGTGCATCGEDGGKGKNVVSGRAAEGIPSSLQMATERFGHFAGGGQPEGWTFNKAFTDPSLTENSTTDIF